jgi:hypothetical protein
MGIPLDYVARQIGDTPETTRRYYAKFIPDRRGYVQLPQLEPGQVPADLLVNLTEWHGAGRRASAGYAKPFTATGSIEPAIWHTCCWLQAARVAEALTAQALAVVGGEGLEPTPQRSGAA